MTGRLELTWPNKDRFLLAPEGADGKPVWVDRTHPAAHEVRLSDFVGALGDVNEADPYGDNLLFVGDSLDVLRILCEVPEYRQRYRGNVRLIYADPPFNTGQAFEHYSDWLEHSTWLSFMRDRLVSMRELLSPTGSLWMHLDDVEVHRMRALMDEVFGEDCFVSEVVWRSSDASNNDAHQVSLDHNTILVYSRNPGWGANALPRTAAANRHYKNPDNDPKGPWFPGNVSSPSPRENLRYVIDESFGWAGTPIPPPANGWRWDKANVAGKITTGEIVLLEETPGQPRLMRKTYLAEQGGLAPSSLWVDIEETGHNRQAKYELKNLFPGVPTAELFDTPKPEKLLAKILTVGTDPGDIVLDPFGGSGTTAAVAHKMCRRWVTGEISPSTVERFTVPRLQKVLTGEDRGGVSETALSEPENPPPDGVDFEDVQTASKTVKKLVDLEVLQGLGLSDAAAAEVVRVLKKSARSTRTRDVLWPDTGGGGFRVVEVRPSMYVLLDDGLWLANWAGGDAFARAVAGQLGFESQEPALHAPFCGVRGRMRLAVVDGTAGPEDVNLIVGALDDGERVTLVAKSLLDGTEDQMREISPGSRVLKAPRDILTARKPGGRRP